MKFAIKDVMNLTIKEFGSDTEYTVIDYANTGEITIEGENDYALIKGQQSIVFPGAKTGTLSVTCDVTEDKALALMLGGEVNANGDISIKGTSKPKMFTATGIVNVVFEDGSSEPKTLECAKITPQTSSSLAFGMDAKTEFTLAFDLMVDTTDDSFVDLKNPTPAS